MKRIVPVLALLLLASAAQAKPSPDAAKTIVRSGRGLPDLLASATRTAWERAEDARPVAIVVDVTPNTKRSGPEIREALEALGDRILHLEGSWRIAPLGGRLSAECRHPSKLALAVDDVLARETDVRNTLRALSRTLSDFGETVAKNEVVTWRVRKVVLPDEPSGGIPPGLTPSESGRDADPTPRPRTRPGSSSGGGPASGR